MGIFNISNKLNWPKYLVEYEKANAHGPTKNTPLDQLHLVVIDIETTGLSKNDLVIAIGGIGITNLTIHMDDILDITVNQHDIDINQSITIHGIMPGEIAKGVPPATALENFFLFIGNKIIVGHHVSFDIRLLNSMAGSLYKGMKILNPTIDISLLFKRLQHFGSPYPIDPGTMTLDSISEHFGVEITDRHTACGDAFITAQVLLKLLSWAKKRGINNAGDLLKR